VLRTKKEDFLHL